MRHKQFIHFCHSSIFTSRFVLPVVSYLRNSGINAVIYAQGKNWNTGICHESKEILEIKKIYWEVTLNFFSMALNFFKLIFVLGRKRPYGIHAHTTKGATLPLVAAMLMRIPVRIYHNHGFPYIGYHGLMRFFLWSLEKINIICATHVISVSHSNVSEAVKSNLFKQMNDCKVFFNGSALGVNMKEYPSHLYTNENKAAAKTSLGVSEKSFVIAYIGRPQKRKGFNFQIKMWEMSGLWKNKCQLIIVGCSEKQCFRVAKKNLPNLTVIEYVDNIPEFLSAVDLISLPSYHEGFGQVVVEAAAAGIPAVGFDIPGLRDAIKNTKTGYLISENDFESYIKICNKLSSSKKLKNKLGKNARKRAETWFSRQSILSEFRQFYLNL